MKATNQVDGATGFVTLPALCYVVRACNSPGSRIVAVRVGELGFVPTRFDCEEFALHEVRAVVDRLNARLGVTPTQKEAMLAGAVNGWHVLGQRATRCALQ